MAGLNVGGNNFYLGNKKVIAYDTDHDTTSISGAIVDFGGSSIKGSGEVLIGQNKATGVFISPSAIQIHGSVCITQERKSGAYRLGDA